MWGSDYTRTSALHSYWDGTHYLREITGLDGNDLAEKIYGGTLRRVFGWPEPEVPASEVGARRATPKPRVSAPRSRRC